MNKYLTQLFFQSILILVLVSCGKNDLPDNKDYKFEIVRIIKLNVPEPSGLDLTFNKDGFWTVSDENSTVYRLDKEGNILRSFKVKGVDLEGITVVNEKTIAVLLERTREVVLTDTLGKEMKRKKLDLKGDLNSGPEGITYDAVNEKFYIVNEKSPGMLIELDKNLNEFSRTELKLAKDYSGIFYEKNNNVLWILSDESKKILITDKSGNLIEQYNTTIDQAEGITLDYENDRLFMVSDRKEELYEYRIIRN
jgi:uncharacterized protein YjiK